MDPIEQVVKSVWTRRIAWSRAADRLKARIQRARSAVLLLGLSGAVLETGAATFLASEALLRSWCAGVGAVFLALVPAISRRFVTIDAIRAWTRARSASEAMKAEVYAFRAKAEPYSGGDSLKIFTKNSTELDKALADIERYAAEFNGNPGEPPPPLDAQAYIDRRVTQQIEQYYRRKARLYAGHLRAFRRCEAIFALVAAGLGALTAVSAIPATGLKPVIGVWVAVLTTLAASIGAHVAASRYDFIVTSYYATARRLEDLVNEWRSDGSPPTGPRWSQFVRDCEQAISVENESWMAKFIEKEK
jgi:hypothetical protein